jgi:hypothetical protein
MLTEKHRLQKIICLLRWLVLPGIYNFSFMEWAAAKWACMILAVGHFTWPSSFL